MTDKVNVPREPTPAMLNAAVDATGAGSGMSWKNLSPQSLFELGYRAMLAAAPKDEPVSDPYKLDLSDVRSKLSEIVECSRALRQGGPAPEDLDELSNALDRATGIADDILANVVWADPSIPVAHPEAPKVEQEHCYECGSTTFISTADIHRACATCNPELLPAPASDELLETLGGGDVIAFVDPERWDHPGAPQLAYAHGWSDAVAKRKGPQ